MSYAYCQSQLATTIKLLDNYDDGNVTLGDYRVLSKGVKKAVVLRPGTFTRERAEFKGGRDTTWNIITELFIKYQDDAQVQSDIWNERQDIIDKVDAYPLLGSGGTAYIFNAYLASGAEPTPVFGADGSGPHFYMQEMLVEAKESLTIAEAE